VKKVYRAGPMRGLPHFNYPAFIDGAARLRARGFEVFSPVEHDLKTHGADISNPTGSEEQAAAAHGFDRRKALAAELTWICAEADAVALLPGWHNSAGARAERATALALGLEVFELEG
jgi:hypothetical protein